MAGFLGGLFSGGKYEQELKEVREKAAREPKNLRLRLRIGDLLEKVGKRAEAVETYQTVAEEYARKGLLIQAIALHKLILRLDPTKSELQEQIADLYAQWGRVGEEMPGRVEEKGEIPPPKPVILPLIPLFSDLKKEELSRVMERIQAKWFGQGKAICKEGDPGNSIFIISHGKVAVLRQQPGRGKTKLAELKEGDFFGEFGYFSNSRRQATVEALEDTEVLELTKEELQKIVREFPSVSQVLFKFYKERVLDNLLATSALFRDFPPAERRQVLNHLSLKEVPAGTRVIQEGDPGDCMYIIKSGEVEVSTSDPKGQKLVLAALQEGDFFGEISLVTGHARTASVTTLRATELVRLGKEDFDRVIPRHPETLKVLEDSLQTRLENKLRMLGVFRKSPAKEGMI
jgi:cAMP-dependent protein kinase regulator